MRLQQCLQLFKEDDRILFKLVYKKVLNTGREEIFNALLLLHEERCLVKCCSENVAIYAEDPIRLENLK